LQGAQGTQQIQQSYNLLNQLINKNVVDQSGNFIGQLKNIVVGQPGGIDYLIVIVTEGGAAGRLVPIPWNHANPTYENGQVKINVSRQMLANAPDFGPGQWPNFASGNVENRIHSYYGTESGNQGRNLNQGTYSYQGGTNQGIQNQRSLNQ